MQRRITENITIFAMYRYLPSTMIESVTIFLPTHRAVHAASLTKIPTSEGDEMMALQYVTRTVFMRKRLRIKG